MSRAPALTVTASHVERARAMAPGTVTRMRDLSVLVAGASGGLGTAIRHELRWMGIRLIDARPPHTETGRASRPLAGTEPRLPHGLEPDAVAARVLAAVVDDERDLPSGAFG